MKYKFRAYNKETGKMILLDPLQWPLRVLDEEENWKVMMFTGLLDRHGKEIYEGDILKWKCSHGAISGGGKVKLHKVTIEWGHLTSAHGYSLTIHKGGEKYAVEKSYWNKEDREIIGNIYENPELIKA
jgi:uncharacterized phage protein (TIGR01671 family)